MPADANKTAEPLLEIQNLTVAYRSEGAWLEAVRDVSLDLMPGQTYGLVGESGSGKTTLALAVMSFLPRGGTVRAGRIMFGGRDLVAQPESEMRKVWGSQMAMVPQDPLSSLNPALRIRDQLAEPLQQHLGMTAGQARARIEELLQMVEIGDPDRVAQSYPHQISGGMQQRVMIAMALSTKPRLLVLDEPTTSLDATTQATILDLVRHLIRASQASVLYVTHNLGVVAQICDRVAVMYAGELVEDAPTEAAYRKPLFPYTRGLWDSVPKLGENKRQVRLRPIQGSIPSLGDLPQGCVFRPRCPVAIERCGTHPPMFQPDTQRRTRCHRWKEIADGEIDPSQILPDTEVASAAPLSGEPVLSVDDLHVQFEGQRPFSAWLRGKRTPPIKAVDGVSLEIESGHTLGLVGESGSGKTTIARALLGLSPATSGEMRLFGERLQSRLGDRTRTNLSRLQIVFQNPQEALNPYLTVEQTLVQPLRRLRGLPAAEASVAVDELLRAVELQPEHRFRLPSQLSGGEKQRVAIARAFAAQPDLLVADEPVTSLDVSVQASILNVLHELQLERQTGFLFISHNLAVVGFLSDWVAVIYLGELVELGRSQVIFDPPYHPYTEALLSAIPLIDPRARQEQVRLEGEVPSPADRPSGCPFHTRCPRFLGEVCVRERPPWRETAQGKRYFCHIPPEALENDQQRVFSFSAPNGPGSKP
jgi:peptide/nickel transport system ATP-binding protein